MIDHQQLQVQVIGISVTHKPSVGWRANRRVLEWWPQELPLQGNKMMQSIGSRMMSAIIKLMAHRSAAWNSAHADGSPSDVAMSWSLLLHQLPA